MDFIALLRGISVKKAGPWSRPLYRKGFGMSQCTVTCFTCRNNKNTGPKTWRENCKDCAEERFDQHRRDTGHTDLHLAVTVDDAPSIKVLQRQVRLAGQIYKMGWMT